MEHKKIIHELTYSPNIFYFQRSNLQVKKLNADGMKKKTMMTFGDIF